MKRIVTFLLVLLMAQGLILRAQNQVTTIVTPKVQLFPTTGLSYLEDPFKYFNVTMTNTSAEAIQIYVDIAVSCDFSATGKTFRVSTPNTKAPVVPITIGANQTRTFNYQDFKNLLTHLNGSDIVWQGIGWQDALMLPEGNYQICVTPYVWDHAGVVPAALPAGQPGCCNFTLCYSGSAPEFTAPVIGQSAGNNNIVNPRTDQNGYEGEVSAVGLTSDNRATSNYTTLTPTNKIVFSWTGVISNCITNNNLNYMFKMVEVMPQQTVLEAINNNAAIYSINAGSRTTCLVDTVKDLQVKMKRGCTYAAQVTAVAKDQNISLRLGNEGKSQVIAFNWGNPTVSTRSLKKTTSVTDSSTNDNKDQVIQSIYNPYLLSPVVDDDAADILVKHFPGESGTRPTNTKSRVNDLYYEFSDKEDLSIAWMPLRGDSVTFVEYALNLYEYIGEDVSYSTTRPPLKSYKLQKGQGSFNLNNTDYIYMPEKWKDTLKSGMKYYLVLEAASHYKYLRTTKYTTTTTTNGIPSTSTSTRNTVMSGTEFFYSNIIFQWGIDSGLMETVKLAQLTYPVDMSSKSGDYKKGDLVIDEVYNDSGLKFKWKRAENVASYDVVTYNLLIAKLGKGKVPTQVKDTLLYYKDITDNEYMCDEIRDSLKVGSQYIAYVETKVKKTKDEDPDYIVPNKGYSYRAAFKIVDTEELTADLDPKVNCYIDDYKAINKKDTLRPKDISDIKKMELKMNKFKVVFEEVQIKTDTLKDKKDKKKKILRKSYWGTGYIVWHPFGVDTRIKVKLDSILFNNDHEIFTGCATTIAADEKSLLPMDFSGKIGDWTEKKVNKIYGEIGDVEDCKEYLEIINEKKASYVTVGGLIGMGDKKESPSFYLPMQIKGTDFFIPDDGANMMLTVNNMRFTPSTALMNLFALFYSHEDNIYIPMLATNICVDPQDFLAGADGGFDMYLAKSIECELKDGYKMRLKAASKLGKKDDGTVISFGKKDGYKRGGFQQLNLEFEFDLATDGLLGINAKSGVPQKGIPVKVSALAVIQEWGNWMARVKMDAFAVEDFPEMSFIPGKGIWYDHSSKSNPTKFPKDYKPKDAKPGTPATSWQGFFMEDLGVILSDKISTAFGTAEDDLNRKAMYTYSYGVNGELKDSSEVAYSKGCLGFHVANMLIDKEGFTADFQVHNVVNAETKSAGGWAFSIDTVGVKVEKNKFKKGYINGTFRVPLLTGRMNYNCVIATDQLTFGLNTNKKDTLGFDLWAAKLELTKSYFKLVHKYDATMEKEKAEAAKKAEEAAKKGEEQGGNTAQGGQEPVVKPQTAIDLKLNGVINIDFDKIGIPISFAGVKFENFTLRNYQEKEDTNAKRLGDSDLWFYMGQWSKASPQHYMSTNTHDAIWKGSIGNVFTYSVETLKPILSTEGDKAKIGFATACKVGFKTGGDTGDAFSLDATCGFKVWGKVNYKNWEFDAKDLGGSLDSIRITTNCFSVFKLDGAVAWIGQEEKDATYGEGMFGTLKVTIMDKLTISMAAGFGTKDENKWWFFEGAATGLKFQVTPVTFTGFGGGFAYNMTVKPDALLINAKACEMISNNKSFASKLVSGGLSSCSYIPKKDSWVAKAGISLALENEKVMNADGVLTLRVSDGKFSGIVIDATAYVMTKVTGDDPTKPAAEKNDSPLLIARTLLGYEETNEMHYFRLSICVKGQLDLANFIKDKAGANNALTELNEKFNCMGENIKTDITSKFDPTQVDKGQKNQVGSEKAQGESSAESKDVKNDSQLKLALSAQVPIDLEIKAYKTGFKPATCTSPLGVDWYFSVGKPTSKKERVMFDLSADLIVCKANAEFTFYFITGNNFDYQLPELDPEVKEFFYGDQKGKQAKSSDLDKVNSQGSSLVEDFGGPKFEKAGGFAMGATFKASVHFEFFLYVDVMAALGFDVALMDTRGQSCEGYDEIGKNNFYAMGQLYAMLKGSAGISINLGFWKGKLELCSLGMGALLKGGGPRPSWAFGLLRLKASVLNGLLSVNTSVDFHVGDVCVPGAGDPLANVNFFESVTPGKASYDEARKVENKINPIGGGVIVSNMPWNEEIILCTEEADAKGVSARKFIFVMEKDLCAYQIYKDGKWINHNQEVKIESYSKDKLIQKFSYKNGGFQINKDQAWTFTARAFEYREPIKDSKGNYEEYYDPTTCKTIRKGSEGEMNWYDPKYENDKDNLVHVFRQDTTIFICSDTLPASLYNQVVYTWPYNGDPSVPVKAIEINSTQGAQAYIYLAIDREDLFNEDILKAAGKEMQAWVLKGYGGKDGVAQCKRITYVKSDSRHSTNYVIVSLPDGFMEQGKPYLIRLIVVNKKDYQAATDVVMQQQQISTLTTYELTSQNWDQVYASHQASKSTSNSGSSGHSSSSSGLGGKVGLGSKVEHQMVQDIKRDAAKSEIRDKAGVDKGRLTGTLNDILGNKGFVGGSKTPTLPSSNSGTLPGKGTTTLPGKGTTTLPAGKESIIPTVSGAGKITNPTIGTKVSTSDISKTNLLNGGSTSVVLKDNNINSATLTNTSNLKGTSDIKKGAVKLKSAAPTGDVSKNQMALSDVDMNSQMANTTLNASKARSLYKSTIGTLSDDNSSSGSGVRKLTMIKKESPVTLVSTAKRVPTTTNTLTSESNKNVNTTTPSGRRVVGTLERETSSQISLLKPLAVVELKDGGFNKVNNNNNSNSSSKQEYLGDIADAQYEKLKEDYTDQGKDTSMLYERTSLEKYTIACSIGDTVYDLCFKTDKLYLTYEDLYSKIMAAFPNLQTSGETVSATQITFPLKNTNTDQQRFNWYSYLFCSYTPNDPTRYNTNVTLPPLASFVIDKKKDTRNNIIEKHHFLMQEFAFMHAILNSVTYPISSIPSQNSKRTGFKDKGSDKGFHDVSCEYKLLKTFIRNPEAKWDVQDYRSLWLQTEGGSIFTTEFPNMFSGKMKEFEEYFDRYFWYLPDILTVNSDQVNKTPWITIKSFTTNEALYEDYKNVRTSTSSITITDKATPAIYNDIKLFFDFFQEGVKVATLPLYHGYSHKEDALDLLYTNEKANAVIQFDSKIPYKVSKAALLTIYFRQWAWLWSNYTIDETVGSTVFKDRFGPETNTSLLAGCCPYTFFWFKHDMIEKTVEDTKGMSVRQNVATLRRNHWYNGMNNLSSGITSTYVKIVYLDKKNNAEEYDYGSYSIYTREKIADQIFNNLYGENSINDSPFLYNNTTQSHWQIKYSSTVTNYAAFKKINDATNALTPASESDSKINEWWEE